MNSQSSPTFFSYYIKMFHHPGDALRALAAEARLLRFAYVAVIISAVLYTLVYIFLIMGHGLPFKPWLRIEPEVYYRYNVFFCAPSMFLAWILCAGVMHLKCRALTNNGSFEQMLGLAAFGISVASWATGVHDLLTSFLGGIHVIDQNEYEEMMNSPTIWRTVLWIQMLLYAFLFVFFFSRAIRVVYGLKWWQCVSFGFGGFIVYQGFFFIFNR